MLARSKVRASSTRQPFSMSGLAPGTSRTANSSSMVAEVRVGIARRRRSSSVSRPAWPTS